MAAIMLILLKWAVTMYLSKISPDLNARNYWYGYSRLREFVEASGIVELKWLLSKYGRQASSCAGLTGTYLVLMAATDPAPTSSSITIPFRHGKKVYTRL